MKILIAACLCLLSLAGSFAKAGDVEFSYGISLIQLMAHPERFDGRTVILMGYLKIRGTDSALFVSRQDLEDGLTFNSVGITNGGNEEFLQKSNDQKAVLVEATFEADPDAPGLGHATAGQLIKIRNLSVLPKLAN